LQVDQLAEKTRDIKLNKKDKLSRKKRNKKEKNEEVKYLTLYYRVRH
jgi:hypothetical protein